MACRTRRRTAWVVDYDSEQYIKTETTRARYVLILFLMLIRCLRNNVKIGLGNARCNVTRGRQQSVIGVRYMYEAYLSAFENQYTLYNYSSVGSLCHILYSTSIILLCSSGHISPVVSSRTRKCSIRCSFLLIRINMGSRNKFSLVAQAANLGNFFILHKFKMAADRNVSFFYTRTACANIKCNTYFKSSLKQLIQI